MSIPFDRQLTENELKTKIDAALEVVRLRF